MKFKALTLGLLLAGAGGIVGCGSSSSSSGGTGGHADAGSGTGGHAGTGGALGTGGHLGTGGAADAGAGTGGAADGGTGTGGRGTGGSDGGVVVGTGGSDGGVVGTGGAADGGTGTGGRGTGGTGTDASLDVATDGALHATLADVFAIVSNVTTPTADTAPGCIHCHDGIAPGTDGGPGTTLPHVMNFTTPTALYASLVGTTSGVPSLICAGTDGGVDGATPAWKRVNPGSADTSAIVSKLRAGLGLGTQCGGFAMPLNPSDGDGGTRSHYAITQTQLNMIIDWINAGALND